MKQLLVFATVLCLFSSCKNEPATDTKETTATSTLPAPANIQYNVVASYPHDTGSYTQGLIWTNNTLYEGTGIEGFSKLMKVDLKTGKSELLAKLKDEEFGEGVTILGGKIYQLTWQNKIVHVYDATTFKKIQDFPWEHEGWGITHNGTDLIVSTGSNNLYFVDPNTFQVKNVVGVFDNNGPVGNLNELEYIDGAVYANIYMTDNIVKIDPSNGHVTGKMDMQGLLEKSGKTADKAGGDVLNGIAYDSAKKSLYITGKKWPLLYEVKL
jgi:glutamine cyclotransferase